MSELFDGVAEAAEEAILNALLAGDDFVGRDGAFVPGLPIDQLAPLLHATEGRGSDQGTDKVQ